MAKFQKTSDEAYDFIMEEWALTGLENFGITLKVMSTTKSKQMLKLSKANPVTEYMLREDAVLTLVVYEEAWDKLEDLQKHLLLKGVFSVLSFDDEKDRLVIDNRPYIDIFNMRHAKDANGNEFGENYDNALEIAMFAIQEVEDEHNRIKEAEKEAKKAKKAKRNQGEIL